MKSEDREITLMNYLDGVSDDAVQAPDLKEDAQELKQILNDLKALPIEQVNFEIDAKMEQFISNNKIQKKNMVSEIWPYLTLAASILLLLLVFSERPTFEQEYQPLVSNPDKLNFIYSLNDKKLQTSDITWLKDELQSESNPNIKVTIIDVLSNYQTKLDKEFFYVLNDETIPSVQMALLNILESSSHIDFSEELNNITVRPDLDITVKQKAKNIILNQ